MDYKVFRSSFNEIANIKLISTILDGEQVTQEGINNTAFTDLIKIRDFIRNDYFISVQDNKIFTWDQLKEIVNEKSNEFLLNYSFGQINYLNFIN